MEIPKFLYHGTTMLNYNKLKENWKIKGSYLQCFGGIDDGSRDIAYKRAGQERIIYDPNYYDLKSGIPVLLIIDPTQNKIEPTTTSNIFKVLDELNPNGHIMIDLTKEFYSSSLKLFNIASNAKELFDFLV